MANISITPVGASFAMPLTIMSPNEAVKPPAIPKAIGTRISAVSGESRFVMMSVMKTHTMAYARKVSIARVTDVPEPTEARYATDSAGYAGS